MYVYWDPHLSLLVFVIIAPTGIASIQELMLQ